MSRLITTSLIGSINWFKECPDSWRKSAYLSLKNTLNRIWTEPSPSAQRGIDFENKVYSILRNKDLDIESIKCSDHFKNVLRKCKGGLFQQKNKSYIIVDGIKYCLYGKEDVTFPDEIKDLKTTSKYKEYKYTQSFQHKIYLYNTKKRKFTYIIVIFENDYSNKIIDVQEIPIRAFQVELEKYEKEIILEIRSIVNFLAAYPELNKAYLNIYSR